MWFRILTGLLSVFFLAVAIALAVAIVIGAPSLVQTAESINLGIFVLVSGGSIGLLLFFSGLMAYITLKKS